MTESAIIETVDINQIARDIMRDLVAYQDGERALAAAEKRTEGLREEQARRRIEIGRQLVEAKRGIRHGGWLPYLEKLGIAARTAQEWMAEAGYMDGAKNAANQDAAHLPSRVAAGIDKRPRRRDEQPDRPRETAARAELVVEEPSSLFASWKHDLSRALVGLDKMIMGYAKSWPKRSRSELVRTLRSVADRVEGLAGD